MESENSNLTPFYLGAGIALYHADCRDVLRSLPENSIDSCCTDPPYVLASIVKRFGSPTAAPAKGNDAYIRASRGFMGKQWDTGECAMSAEFWAEVLRVLKPGAHLVSYGGTRGYHRMTCAIEDAGFEIRDSLMWLYGTGFPKSHNIGDGWGTALKPAFEPIVLARKPLSEKTIAANVLKWGTGAINIDACRIGTDESTVRHSFARMTSKGTKGGAFGNTERIRHMSDVPIHAGGSPLGRWPANVVHDGSDEVIDAFPHSNGQQGALKGGESSKAAIYGKFGPKLACEPRNDSGSAARFFYSAKASKADRAGSKHPTVKPVSLNVWLAKLITPPGGVVLDPFAGSGSLGVACERAGFRSILIEREKEYADDIKRRLDLSMAEAA